MLIILILQICCRLYEITNCPIHLIIYFNHILILTLWFTMSNFGFKTKIGLVFSRPSYYLCLSLPILVIVHAFAGGQATNVNENGNPTAWFNAESNAMDRSIARNQFWVCNLKSTYTNDWSDFHLRSIKPSFNLIFLSTNELSSMCWLWSLFF